MGIFQFGLASFRLQVRSRWTSLFYHPSVPLEQRHMVGGGWVWDMRKSFIWTSHQSSYWHCSIKGAPCMSKNTKANTIVALFFLISFAFKFTHISSKEETTTYLFWDCPKLKLYIYGPIKDAHHKNLKFWTLGVPTTN